MQEVVINDREKTLVARYDPVMKDYDINEFNLYPGQYEDLEKGVQILAASMEEFGQGRPVYCVNAADNMLQIIEGGKIWRAAKFSGWSSLTAIVLNKIDAEDVLPLMMALKSHNHRFSYRLIATRYDHVKKYAQKYIQENQVEGNEASDLTTRQFVQKVLGFPNEHYTSDFEHILKSPDRDFLLDQLDKGLLKFSKAVNKAKGKAQPPKPDTKSYMDQPNVFMCEDCPRRQDFLNKLENDESADSIDDLSKNEV